MSTMQTKELSIFHYDDLQFDLFRLSKSKETVDICSNTLRSYHRQGLPFYRQGKAVFISRTELADFIRSKIPKTKAAAEVPPVSDSHAENQGDSHAEA